MIGTPAPFGGAMTFTGNWLHDTFNNPLAYGGHEGNFQAYVNTLTLAPGATKSLLHYIVLGARVTTATSAAERLKVEATATTLAATPELSGLTPAQVCSIDNFSIATSCTGVGSIPRIPVPAAPRPVTTSGYDVVEKTIGQMRADMESGLTTSQAITRAYLDRIAVYDQGQFGFNAYEIVASDAMAQAAAADAARAAGKQLAGARHPDRDQEPLRHLRHGDHQRQLHVRGLPAEEGRLPGREAARGGRRDHRQGGARGVRDQRQLLQRPVGPGVERVQAVEVGARVVSGGSATAVAANLAAGALGSQTGDSLYAPASGASLVTLRGTDGLESGSGIMPLSWLTDFGGAMARSVADLADMLNVVTGTDPDDPTTAPADAERPADWRSVLDVNALQGKRIGYIPSTWEDPFGTTGTIAASKAALKYLTDAGATIVEMGSTVGDANTPPAPPNNPTGNTTQEGWMQYIDAHPELAEQGFQIRNAVDVSCSQKKVAYTRAGPERLRRRRPPRG